MKKDFFDDDSFKSDSIDFDPEERDSDRFTGDSDDDWFESRPKKKKSSAGKIDRRNPETARRNQPKSAVSVLIAATVLTITAVFCGMIGLAGIFYYISSLTRPSQNPVSSRPGVATPTPRVIGEVESSTSEMVASTPESSPETEDTEVATQEDSVVDIYEDLIIDEILFPDEAFRNFILEEVDLDSDGILSRDERSGVTDLSVVFSQGIKNLQGIEYFVYLKTLDCGWNELTELDVSHNPELEILSCAGNNLTELDVSHNPRLRNLYCFENGLTTLDVTCNPELRHLECYDNHLSELDLSQNPKLSMLMCKKNQLTELDVSYNPELAILECQENLLSELDFSNNPAMLDLDVDADVTLVGLRQESMLSLHPADWETEGMETTY